jgi:phage portal protein BeeE
MRKNGIRTWLRQAWQIFARAGERKTVLLPAAARGVARYPLPKPTPANLRRFSETPVTRKAINTIKDRIATMRWRVQGKEGGVAQAGDVRLRVLRANLETPNADDSFRTLTEQVIEDVLVGGCGAIEVQTTPDPQRPLLLWPVDGTSVRIYAGWSGDSDEPRYAQVTPWGQRVDLRNDELVYIRLNSRTHTPFGLGRLEVAFETISWLLGAQEHAARLASNTIVQFALWLAEMPPASYDKVISWWQNEIEGTGRVPIIANLPAKPEVLRFSEGSDRDLRLEWQHFLIRIVADAFDLPPLLLGLEQDVNRATADALVDEAFRTAVVPTARLYAEHLTREVIGRKLGWDDLEFVFDDLEVFDERAQAEVDEILLRSDVLLPDEVRVRRALPALPGGWGALSHTQRQMLIGSRVTREQ